ncbi:hypothetical protein GUJ93_ZPchr0006g41256 [Zizania palustris]|uniref:Uncharacterized protein n=1 Tax=Zizania palustris TaxID=103762 RepID=A0A8J5SIT6_ZIZPA|nr:hypothetical protein GUJ93_ZPchr0006g41256 [Zizania palustris]
MPAASAATHVAGLLHDRCRRTLPRPSSPAPLHAGLRRAPSRRTPPCLLPADLRRCTVASLHVAGRSTAPPHAGHRFGDLLPFTTR